jgi:hypothetical protein
MKTLLISFLLMNGDSALLVIIHRVVRLLTARLATVCYEWVWGGGEETFADVTLNLGTGQVRNYISLF